MALNNRDYYNEFISKINNTLTVLEEDIITGETNVNDRIKSIKPFSRQLATYCDITLVSLHTISSVELRHKMNKLKSGKVLYSDKAMVDVLQAAAEGLIIAKRVLERTKASIVDIRKHKVTYPVYNDILKLYNNHVVDELLLGRKVYLGNGFGNLFVRIIKGKTASEVTSINWKESIKRKATILAKDGIPYITKDAEDCKAKGIDYKGERWCVTSDIDGYPYIGWTGRTSIFYKEYYKFNPTRDNNTGKTMDELLTSVTCLNDINELNVGIVKKLSLYLSFNPKHIVNYFKRT